MIDEMREILDNFRGITNELDQAKTTEDVLTALKTLFLKTIEECKPKDRDYSNYKPTSIVYEGSKGFNKGISTYYDNLKRKCEPS